MDGPGLVAAVKFGGKRETAGGRVTPKTTVAGEIFRESLCTPKVDCMRMGFNFVRSGGNSAGAPPLFLGDEYIGSLVAQGRL